MKFNAYLRHISGAIAIAPLISLNYSTYCQTAIAPLIWLNYHKKAAAAFLAAAAFNKSINLITKRLSEASKTRSARKV